VAQPTRSTATAAPTRSTATASATHSSSTITAPFSAGESPLLAAIRARTDDVHLDNASNGAPLRELAMDLFRKRHPELSELIAAPRRRSQP